MGKFDVQTGVVRQREKVVEIKGFLGDVTRNPFLTSKNACPRDPLLGDPGRESWGGKNEPKIPQFPAGQKKKKEGG